MSRSRAVTKAVPITISLPPSLLRKLDALVEERLSSRSSIVRELVLIGMRRLRRRQPIVRSSLVADIPLEATTEPARGSLLSGPPPRTWKTGRAGRELLRRVDEHDDEESAV